MQRMWLKNPSWLGVVSLIFVLIAVPAALAQSSKRKPAEPAVKVQTTASKVDINHATQKDLEALPGVGEATAKKIIADRPYASVEDLAKAGVPKSTIAKITPLVMVGAMPPVKATSTAPPPTTKTVQTPSVAPTTAAPPAKTEPQTATAFTPPPSAGMVWVNLETKVYHKEGDRWYGKTKKGKYMTEADAIKAGYRLAK